MAKRIENKQNKKKAKLAAKAKAPAVKNFDSTWLSNGKVALGLFGLAFLAHYVTSFISDGFYQHDEVGHLNSMRAFWNNPNIILGNWAKPGYKLIYVVPSLLGNWAVVVLNSLFAAASGYLAYLLSKKLGSKMAILAAILVATQPVFFSLAFRNYSEVVTSVILAGAVYMHYKGKWNIATFLLAYVCIIRQEMFPLLAAYGLVLLKNRQWLAIVYGSIPVLALNLWGGIVKKDPIYLVSQILGTSKSYGKAYPRQGFWHYLSTSEVIFGAVVLVLVALYFGTRKSKKDWHWFLIVPAIYFMIIQTIFNIKSWDLGPATGGNLRYLITIAPLLAVIGTLGLEKFLNSDNRKIGWITGGIMTALLGLYMTFSNNTMVLLEDREWSPFFIAASVLGVLALPRMKNYIYVLILSLIALIGLSINFMKFPLTPEDKTVRKVSNWYDSQVNMADGSTAKLFESDADVYSYHNLFPYWLETARHDIPGGAASFKQEDLPGMKVGSIIFWDSHYSYRPKLRPTSVNKDYFISKPNTYKKLKEWISEDRRFQAIIFKKIAEEDPKSNEAMKAIETKNFSSAASQYEDLIKKDPNNPVHHLMAGKAYFGDNKLNKALTALNKSIELDSKSKEAFLERAKLQLAIGNYDKAVGDANQVIILDSKDVNGYYLKGNAYFQMNRYEFALEQYVTCDKMTPNNGGIIYNVAMCQINMKDVKSACTNLDLATKLGNKEAAKLMSQFCK